MLCLMPSRLAGRVPSSPCGADELSLFKIRDRDMSFILPIRKEAASKERSQMETAFLLF